MPSTSDLSLIGVYTVTIRAEISVPDDYTKTTYTTIPVEYTYDLRMEPCQMNLFLGDPIVSDLSYVVGQPSVTSGIYGFT